MSNPGKDHSHALKWIMRYLQGSVNVGLKFSRQQSEIDDVIGYVDSDFAGSVDTRKSLT